MRALVYTIFFLLMAVLFSCEDTGWLVNCEDCYPDEPTGATLELKLDDDPSVLSAGVVVNIYEGNIEDNTLVTTFRTFGASTNQDVILNKKYSVSATYITNEGITYIAVDSATPRVRYEKSQCDEKCFFIYDKVIDLRIKYIK